MQTGFNQPLKQEKNHQVFETEIKSKDNYFGFEALDGSEIYSEEFTAAYPTLTTDDYD